MNTTIATVIAALIAAQAVKSYNDYESSTPPVLELTESELSVIQKEVTGVAGGIRAWHGQTVTTAEQWAETPEQKASAAADRKEFEAGVARQDEALSLFDALMSALGLKSK